MEAKRKEIVDTPVTPGASSDPCHAKTLSKLSGTERNSRSRSCRRREKTCP